MGAPGSGIKAGEQPAAETLLTAFKKIDASERRRHASVLNYWLSIRGDKEFPPLHDLDPLELSDAGPSSILLELISGGHDAEIRHMGEALRDGDWPERIMDAEGPSILTCIAKKLPIVAISRDFLAFEDEFEGDNGPSRCWVTLLPLSAGGAWVDYVYAFATVDVAKAKAAKPGKTPKKAEADDPIEDEVVDELAAEEIAEEPVAEIEQPVAEVEVPETPEDEVVDEVVEDEPQAEAEESVAEFEEPTVDEVEEAPVDEYIEDEPEEPAAAAVSKAAPGFSKLLDSLAGLTGFYGSQPVKVDPVVYEPEQEPILEEVTEEPAEAPVEEPAAEEPPVEEFEEPVAEAPAPEESPKTSEPTRASEGTLKDKLADVRAKADEAREAKLRANVALYEGLSAAYDFALDAEEAPEDYLRLVEAQGLKIQLRSPMKPVVKLAFDGMCDDATIKQLEAVLAWAFDQELARGTLVDQIEAAGGIGPILQAKAA